MISFKKWNKYLDKIWYNLRFKILTLFEEGAKWIGINIIIKIIIINWSDIKTTHLKYFSQINTAENTSPIPCLNSSKTISILQVQYLPSKYTKEEVSTSKLQILLIQSFSTLLSLAPKWILIKYFQENRLLPLVSTTQEP